MDLESAAKKIETMEVRGAAKIARVAAEALKDFASGYDGSDVEEFKTEMKRAGDRLISTRPTAISLKNAVMIVLKEVRENKNLDELKKNIIATAEKFIAKSEKE
jgi:ribose 1,5-bisphosphate isomerase